MKVGSTIKLRCDARTTKAVFKKGLEMTVVDDGKESVHLKDRAGRHLIIKKTRMAVCVKKIEKK